MILESNQVLSYLYNAGFNSIQSINALKICYCESSFDTLAHNKNGEDSRGLFQINVNAHPEYQFLDLYDPQINCNVAFEIFTNAGNTFKDWSCAYLLDLVNPTNIFGIGLAFIIIALYLSTAQ